MNIKTFMEYFDKVKDPRKGNAKKHALSDILVLTCLGIICGAETWIEIEDFGRLHKGWLKNILDLKHGIPSHDTLARVIARINPKAFQDILIHLTRDMAKEMEEQFIAIDGKTLRRSHDNRNHQSALHLVSAWATHNHLTLGQISTDKKKNEIKAIDKLLDVLDIKRCTVTIDAMGCQKALAKKIIDKGGHYLFTVKANQGKLHQCLIKLFNDAKDHETFDGKRMVFSEKQSIDGDHGRIEERYYAVIPSMYSCIQQKNWPKLKSFIQVSTQREINGHTGLQTRYYISSLLPNAEKLADGIRSHWSIENSLHWSLDVTFNEDQARIRRGHAAENIAFLRRFALSILKKENSFNGSLRRKQRKAFLQPEYLLQILKQI